MKRISSAGGPAAVFVDSSAWIALFRARDTHHDEAESMFRRAFADRIPLLTTNLVLAEIHRFLLHRVGMKPAVLALEHIAASPHATVRSAATEHDREARQWLRRLSDQRISYTDAVSFAVMRAARLRNVMTFDHDFVVAGFLLWH